LKYPNEIKTKGQKLFYWLSNQEYIFNQGRMTIGKFSGLLPEFGWGFTVYMGVVGRRVTLIEVLVITLGILVFAYILGYYWTSHKCDKIQLMVSTSRNPQLQKVFDKVVTERDSL
jgi:hypothetical protein